VFTLGFVFFVGSFLPFPKTFVHSRLCLLGGICLSLPEDLCSLQVLFPWWVLSFPSRGLVFTPGLFSWWGLSYPSRRPVFTPGFVYLVGSVFPFSRTCVHSGFCFLGGVCLTLRENLCSLQVLFSLWDLSFLFPGPVFKTDPTKKTKPGASPVPREGKDRPHQENKTWSEHRSSGRERQIPPSKQNLE
jgi:hypothetical protein